MAADRARADDEEDLKASSFQKGEWEQTRPTELDIDYALLAGALDRPAHRSRKSMARLWWRWPTSQGHRGAGGGPARVGGWRFGEVGSFRHLAPRYTPGHWCGGGGFTRHGDGGLHDGAPFLCVSKTGF